MKIVDVLSLVTRSSTRLSSWAAESTDRLSPVPKFTFITHRRWSQTLRNAPATTHRSSSPTWADRWASCWDFQSSGWLWCSRSCSAFGFWTNSSKTTKRRSWKSSKVKANPWNQTWRLEVQRFGSWENVSTRETWKITLKSGSINFQSLRRVQKKINQTPNQSENLTRFINDSNPIDVY